eukprot:11079512-Ditylum_brightwellii.AAC.1
MDTQPEETANDTTTIQPLSHFTTFVFGATGTPNPAPTPVATNTTTKPPARTDLNDHPNLENTYANNRTTPSH